MMDKENFAQPLADQLIEIPEPLSVTRAAPAGAVYATCADWCQEECPVCWEHSDQCSCSSEGGQCSCSNQNNQCSCSNQNNQCSCSNQNNQCICSSQNNQGSPPSRNPSTLSVSAIGPSTLRVRWSGSPSDATYCIIAVRPSSTYTADYLYDMPKSGSITIDEYNGSPLTPNTTYLVNIQACNSYGCCGFDTSFAKRATTPPERAGYFSWKRGVVSSLKSSDATVSGEDFSVYLTAARWNEFTQNIRDVGAGASFTKAVGGKTKLSADMVNEAINAINSLNPSVSPPSTAVSNRTNISAALLNGLANSLNSIS